MCREYYLHKRPNGIPTGKEKATKPIVEAASLETIIKAIRKLELSADDALKIVSALKSLGLIDISAVKNTGLIRLLLLPVLQGLGRERYLLCA